jgi:hypothetical protein
MAQWNGQKVQGLLSRVLVMANQNQQICLDLEHSGLFGFSYTSAVALAVAIAVVAAAPAGVQL